MKFTTLLLLTLCSGATFNYSDEIISASDNYNSIDFSLLQNLSGKESPEVRQLLFKPKHFFWIHLREPAVLDHLYELARSNKLIELDRQKNYHEMIKDAKSLKAEWEARRAGLASRAQNLRTLCNTPRIRPIKVIQKKIAEGDLQVLEVIIRDLDEKILKMQVVLEYCSDPQNPCYVIKQSLLSQ